MPGVEHFETFDQIYRSLCAVLYNFVPKSGHPGGSVSSGRIVEGVLFDSMAYDLRDPDRADADIISYAAGHKAMGLYAMWALRDEVARAAAPDLLPGDERYRLRLEDLLGFRRNPTTGTPLFRSFNAKPLDGHPSPATPFVKLSTGASGVGVASSLGLALGAMDRFGRSGAPRVHIIEGEGGLTPGRVSEALAFAGTASLGNAVIHLDWNQASIDSDRVCRDGDTPGDYVQWDPRELAYLHDFNVIDVADGFDFGQVLAAQRRALEIDNGQPTMIVYRTVKGWRYGIEGKSSHGAGHDFLSDGFRAAVEPLLDLAGETLTATADDCKGPGGALDPVKVEAVFWDTLGIVRRAVEKQTAMAGAIADRLREARERLDALGRSPRNGAGRVDAVYRAVEADATPESLRLEPGQSTTLRGQLGKVLDHLNRESGGAIIAAAADLLGSTSVKTAGAGFADGFFNAVSNPDARLIAAGGICEDAMCGVLSGLSACGGHIGVGSSYGAFIAALGHVSARLHAIGAQCRSMAFGDAYRPFVLVCAHAGLKTGEDGPTHADPQPLQLLQDNFPKGTAVTLTPWDPAEVWPLMAAALRARPAVIAPFVTRPNETIIDRAALGLAPAEAASKGVYRLRSANGEGDGTLVLQGSGVTYAFVEGALPRLEERGIDLNVYCVTSAELFDLLDADEREAIFPGAHRRRAIGITGFTRPTMERWILSDRGRELTLHPFKRGHYLGSGQAEHVLAEAGLDGESQFESLTGWIEQGWTGGVGAGAAG